MLISHLQVLQKQPGQQLLPENRPNTMTDIIKIQANISITNNISMNKNIALIIFYISWVRIGMVGWGWWDGGGGMGVVGWEITVTGCWIVW